MVPWKNTPHLHLALKHVFLSSDGVWWHKFRPGISMDLWRPHEDLIAILSGSSPEQQFPAADYNILNKPKQHHSGQACREMHRPPSLLRVSMMGMWLVLRMKSRSNTCAQCGHNAFTTTLRSGLALDHDPSSKHFGCIYTSIFMWSHTIQFQPNQK